MKFAVSCVETRIKNADVVSLSRKSYKLLKTLAHEMYKINCVARGRIWGAENEKYSIV